VCLTVIRVLVRLGQQPEAVELIDATARALLQCGLDGDDFRRRGLAEVGDATDRSVSGQR
jgi:hypothetical protein